MSTSSDNIRRQTYTLEESARLLGIGRFTAYQCALEGRIPFPCIRLGRRYVIPKGPLDRFLAIGKSETEGPN